MEVNASAHGEVVIGGIEFDEEHGDGAFDTGVSVGRENAHSSR
jgi:hypothetical protein